MIVETVDFYNGLIIYNVSAVEDISTWCVCKSLQMSAALREASFTHPGSSLRTT